ncbi:glycosyltransferase [Methylobacterium sp. J-070]|uniref:glycosyltransferase family protein n=1 Tax=Methylobacterium sp. J-070 TaxID=2836650 RepID=UPI001FBA9A65|nr:glycosyltransferase [Methylobacterium sp. J-070]MCJ2054938.1 glycosyltransferase [Methylobacterium sp. J-070]
MIQRLSRFPITVLNLGEYAPPVGTPHLAPDVDLDSYAAIILHHTLTDDAAILRGLDAYTRRKLKDYAGVKVLMRREDGGNAQAVATHMAETGYDILFTNLPPESVGLIYPQEALDSTLLERMLPGYVTPTQRAIDTRLAPRPIDIGYRGEGSPRLLDSHAWQAGAVGAEIVRRLAGRGLLLDIANRREERFDSDAWTQFLLSCKATLGAEDGVRLFDLDGTLAHRIADIEAELGPLREDPDHAQAYLARLSALEGRIDARQIAPAQFEAAACGTLQLLVPGHYSGLLVPGRHFIPIAPGGDLNAAVAIIRDEAQRGAIVEAARAEVILDRANWIETFIGRLDDRIEEVGQEKGAFTVPKLSYRGERQVLLLSAMEPRHDPRHGWTERHAPPDVLVHQLGVLESDEAPILRTSTRDGLYWAVPRLEWVDGTAFTWFGPLGTSPTAVAILHELAFLERAYRLPQEEFATLVGAPTHAPRLGSLRFSLRVLLATTMTLVEAGRRLRGVQAIIASDAFTLPAAIILKELFGIEVLYDAHEYMPEMIPESNEFERQFFSALERRLVAHTDARQTVTPGLAGLMAVEYGRPFDVVVNAEPNEDVGFEAAHRPDSTDCIFLFCGLFGSGRGLALLVDAWPDTPPNAILHLQGPHNPLKGDLIARAEANGLLGTRILFPDPVPETEIVASMRRADVGFIPYEPISTNHRFCCPNKTSQYMRAGLPILANDTNFVGAIIREAECGRVVDFSDRARFVAAVAELTADPDLRRQLGRKARTYFETSFNWQSRSRVMYERLEAMLTGRGAGELTVINFPEPIPPVPPAEAQRPAPVEPTLPEEVAIQTPEDARAVPHALRRFVRPIARAFGLGG